MLGCTNKLPLNCELPQSMRLRNFTCDKNPLGKLKRLFVHMSEQISFLKHTSVHKTPDLVKLKLSKFTYDSEIQWQLN